MGAFSIPVRLTAAESGAAALAEAAESLSGADEGRELVRALNLNHDLWVTLSGVTRRIGWSIPDGRVVDYALSTTRHAGWGAKARIQTLIAIDREVGAALANGHNLTAIRRRAVLAWQENGLPRGVPLVRWLADEIERKTRILG